MIYNIDIILNDIKNFILKYPNKNWNIDYIIKNNIITDFKDLNKLKNIIDYIINKYPNNPWKWLSIFKNTNIDIIDFILKHHDHNSNDPLVKNKLINFKGLSKIRFL